MKLRFLVIKIVFDLIKICISYLMTRWKAENLWKSSIFDNDDDLSNKAFMSDKVVYDFPLPETPVRTAICGTPEDTHFMIKVHFWHLKFVSASSICLIFNFKNSEICNLASIDADSVQNILKLLPTSCNILEIFTNSSKNLESIPRLFT